MKGEGRHQAGSARVIARNVVYNFLSQIGLLLFTLAATPYIVRSLGDDAYGVLSIATTVIGLLEFLDLGLSTAVEKFVAQYEAQDRYADMGKLVGTALVMNLVMGLVGASIIGALSALLVVRVFNIPIQLQETARIVLTITGLRFFLRMPRIVFQAIPRALQRFDLFNLVNTLSQFAQTGMTIALLIAGFFLVEIALLQVVVGLATTLAYVVFSWRMLPMVDLRPAFDRQTARSLLRYGAPVSFGKLAVGIATRLDTLLLAFYLPVSSVTYYAVAFSVASKLYLIPWNVVPATFPALSALQSQGNTDEVSEVYVRSTKYVAIATIPLAVLLIVLSEDILRLWLGAPFDVRSAWALRGLALAIAAHCLGHPAVAAANGLGHTVIPATVNTLQAVLSVSLYLILIPRFGLNGAALGWLVPQVLLSPTLIYLVNRYVTNVSTRLVAARALLKPVLLALALGVLTWVSRPHIVGFLSLALVVGLGTGLYTISAYLLATDVRERRFLQRWMMSALARCHLVIDG